MATADRFGGRRSTWRRTVVMGVVNVTPDSFSDGGAFADPAAAIAHGGALVARRRRPRRRRRRVDAPGRRAGVGARGGGARAAGGASARAARVTVSIDTYKAEVAAAALDAGAEIVNDVSGGTLDPELLRVVARHRRGVSSSVTCAARRQTWTRTPVTPTWCARCLSELRRAGRRARVAAGVSTRASSSIPGSASPRPPSTTCELLARLGELRAPRAARWSSARRASRSSAGSPAAPSGERELATAAADTAAILARRPRGARARRRRAAGCGRGCGRHRRAGAAAMNRRAVQP